MKGLTLSLFTNLFFIMPDFSTVQDQLWSLPIADLHRVKHSINDIIQTKIKASLKIDDEVVVVSPNKREDGIITKINKSRALVKIGQTSYNVPFGMIEVKSKVQN